MATAYNEQTLTWKAVVSATATGFWPGSQPLPVLLRVTARATIGITETSGTADAVLMAATTQTYAETSIQIPASAVEAVHLYEDKVQRRSVRLTAAYGKVVEYQRTVLCAEGNLTAAYAGVLALGSTMPDTWRDTGMGTGVGVDSALLQSVAMAEPVPSGGKRRLLLTYTAVEAIRTDRSYRETVRTAPRHKDAFTDVYETWGIATGALSWGVPEEGDYLSGYSRTTYAPMCVHVDIDTTSQHGRVIVHATWEAVRTSWLAEIGA